MYTCLQAGGVYGVLAADGRKRYSQPIGGVIAYREQVSISGVGYDIACRRGQGTAALFSWLRRRF
jgi:tRNA-splicing ligase RtcB (3'-phosphate/5'-hydroxy nucleic acid ligase)